MGVEVVDDLLERIAEGAHADDDAVCVLGAIVVEQVIARAELRVDLVHVCLDDLGKLVVGRVAGLTMLEEDIAVLVCATGMRMLRVECVVTEALDSVHVEHVLEVVEVPHGDLLDLVGGAEAVEEVQERHATLDGSKVCHRSEVHDLLDIALGEHGKAGLAASHDIRVVAEDVQGMGRDRTGTDMEDCRQSLGSNLVHVRNHEEQALRCRVGGRQSTSAKGTVHGARSTCLRLHLDNLDRRAEDVLQALGRPLIDVVCHWAGRGDRVDARHLGERIRDPRSGLVAVHRLELSCHILSFEAIRSALRRLCKRAAAGWILQHFTRPNRYFPIRIEPIRHL